MVIKYCLYVHFIAKTVVNVILFISEIYYNENVNRMKNSNYDKSNKFIIIC